MRDTIENEYCSFWIEDGILFLIYKPIPYLTVSMTQEIVSSRLLFQGDEALPIFCDTRGILDISKEARDYLAQEGSLLSIAIAIFDDRKIAKFMVDFYHFRNRPLVPSIYFNDREKALEFLKGYQ